MELPAPHRFSVEDYHRLGEAGVLKPDARVELLDGAIHDMSPIGPLHGGITKRLVRFFILHARGRWIVSAQDPVGLDFYSEPQPDIMLLKPAPDDYTTHHPTPDDVLLLIEVSDSSLDYDHRKKIPVYARCGIQEVWIVNLKKSTIEVFREPHLTGYEFREIVRKGSIISPKAFADAVINVTELLSTQASR